MIKDLGCPHIFATFSAADLQWHDLHRHMPTSLPPNATEDVCIKTYNNNLNNNHAIAAYYFQKRWELFLKHVLTPKFGIRDFWYRYEWQHCGSSHVHCFFWLDKAPKVEDLDISNEESVNEFIRFWDPLVSTTNPSKDEPKATVHPSSQDPNTLTYSQRELAQLLNWVQRHTRCTPYCLRRPKGAPADALPICRFKYPKELSGLTTLVLDDKGLVQLITKRNDTLLKEFNPTQILGW
jgi:Helitron helicase-like domain at N-terminus